MSLTQEEIELLSVSTETEATKTLLNHISRRLAGREDCKDVNYTVTIDCHGVHMEPLTFVFPNRYRRHESDKLDIVAFVHNYKMPNAVLSDFAFGVYRYQSSYDGTRRKWVKII